MVVEDFSVCNFWCLFFANTPSFCLSFSKNVFSLESGLTSESGCFHFCNTLLHFGDFSKEPLTFFSTTTTRLAGPKWDACIFCKHYSTLAPSKARFANSTILWRPRRLVLQTVQHFGGVGQVCRQYSSLGGPVSSVAASTALWCPCVCCSPACVPL